MYNGYMYGGMPMNNKMMLENHRDRLNNELARCQAEYARIQSDLNLVNGQLKVFEQPAAPPPGDPQAALMNQFSQMIGVPGLTSQQLQAAVTSPDGQALSKLFQDELASIVKKQTGQAAQPAN